MIELYVIMTLLGIGYVVNQQGKPNQKMKALKMPPNMAPTTKNVYSSDMQGIVKKMEMEKARAAFAKSLQKLDQGHVVNRDKSILVSTLAGKEVPKADFKHNNMVPFFKGSVNQNFQRDGNKGIMERFMGAPDEVVLQKREQAPLFKAQRDVYNCNGAPVQTDFMRDRVVESTLKTNIRPFEQVRVGPGLGQGYESRPTGGFQQIETQEFARPKTVDELRIASKPKSTFDARTVDGQKGSRPGKMGKMDKNRVDTFYKNTPERYFKTTGATLKEAQPGVYDAKYTNRLDTSKEYSGPAFNNKEQTVRDSQIKPTSRMQLDPFQPTAPNLTNLFKQEKTDYGKGSILVYSNERDITSQRTYQGNLTSLVKAIVAPIEDMIKITRKEHTIDNPRPNGQLQAQMPSKQPVLDPNNVMRTTIKETTIHDTQLANLKGNSKITVYDPNEVARITVKQTTIDNDAKLNLRGPNRSTAYDPNDVARTTLKETSLHDSDTLNLNGPKKIQVYDPNDTARTTLKETNLHDSDTLNLKGRSKNTVYDPNDIARTTMKETMLHDAEYTNLRGDRTANAVYVDEQARITVRQTTAAVDTELNVNGGRRVGVAYDPEDPARTTVRETTLDTDREGNVDGLQRRNAAYTDAQYDAPTTQKELYTDDYYGQPARENGDGYQVLDIDLPTTQKELISDIEYYGNSADQNEHKQMSYADMYNACISDMREPTLVGRDPTQTGVKLAAGSDNVSIDVRRSQFDIERSGQDRITNQLQPIKEDQVTRFRNDESVERLDASLLEAFRNNPFTQPLDSFA